MHNEISSPIPLNEIIHGSNQLQRFYTKFNRRPEVVTEEFVMESILKLLGYPFLEQSSGSAGDIDPRESDYTLQADDERILVEAEPLNKRLFDTKEHGVEQVKFNLEKRSFHLFWRLIHIREHRNKAFLIYEHKFMNMLAYS
ncbi:MAG TPA: hypothetical protein VE130_03625 [Nitrososphaeraceae archaeon]|nr:hypothetical protein [Nitrososphaeraceae archaeon]